MYFLSYWFACMLCFIPLVRDLHSYKVLFQQHSCTPSPSKSSCYHRDLMHFGGFVVLANWDGVKTGTVDNFKASQLLKGSAIPLLAQSQFDKVSKAHSCRPTYKVCSNHIQRHLLQVIKGLLSR